MNKKITKHLFGCDIYACLKKKKHANASVRLIFMKSHLFHESLNSRLHIISIRTIKKTLLSRIVRAQFHSKLHHELPAEKTQLNHDGPI